jgi:CRP-like cAMP-binding protein
MDGGRCATPAEDTAHSMPSRYGYSQIIYNSGTVEVLRTLSDGDFFGELALIHKQPRTATVRAVGYCDLYSLDRKAFIRTLNGYPDFVAHIEKISGERIADLGS